MSYLAGRKTGWTAAAAMLAWDALNEITSAGKLFNHKFWLR